MYIEILTCQKQLNSQVCSSSFDYCLKEEFDCLSVSLFIVSVLVLSLSLPWYLIYTIPRAILKIRYSTMYAILRHIVVVSCNKNSLEYCSQYSQRIQYNTY